MAPSPIAGVPRTWCADWRSRTSRGCDRADYDAGPAGSAVERRCAPALTSSPAQRALFDLALSVERDRASPSAVHRGTRGPGHPPSWGYDVVPRTARSRQRPCASLRADRRPAALADAASPALALRARGRTLARVQDAGRRPRAAGRCRSLAQGAEGRAGEGRGQGDAGAGRAAARPRGPACGRRPRLSATPHPYQVRSWQALKSFQRPARLEARRRDRALDTSPRSTCARPSRAPDRARPWSACAGCRECPTAPTVFVNVAALPAVG